METARDVFIRTAMRDRAYLDSAARLFELTEECRSELQQKPQTLRLLDAIEQLQKTMVRSA